MKRTFERIFVHTTAASYKTVPTQFLAVNRWHKERWGAYYNEKAKETVNPSSMGYYGGYTILIEPDGKEFRYREDWEETIAVFGHNRTSLSVSLAFDGDNEMPTSAQIATLRERLKKWTTKYNIPIDKDHISPHRAVADKSCYGKLLSDTWAVDLLLNEPKDELAVVKGENVVKEYNPAKDKLMIQLLTLKIKLLKLLLGKREPNI